MQINVQKFKIQYFHKKFLKDVNKYILMEQKD